MTYQRKLAALYAGGDVADLTGDHEREYLTDANGSNWLRQALMYYDEVYVQAEGLEGSNQHELLDLVADGHIKQTPIKSFLDDLDDYDPDNPPTKDAEEIVATYADQIIEYAESLRSKGLLSEPELINFFPENEKVEDYFKKCNIPFYKDEDQLFSEAVFMPPQIAEFVGYLVRDTIARRHNLDLAFDRSLQFSKAYYPTHNFTKSPELELYLENLLPVPMSHVPLADIVHFRKRYYDELVQFRTEIDGLKQDLRKCSTQDDLRFAMDKFLGKRQAGLNELRKAIESAKFDSRLQTYQVVAGAFSGGALADYLTTAISGGNTTVVWSAAALGGIAAISGTYQRYRKSIDAIQSKSDNYLIIAERQRLIRL